LAVQLPKKKSDYTCKENGSHYIGYQTRTGLNLQIRRSVDG